MKTLYIYQDGSTSITEGDGKLRIAPSQDMPFEKIDITGKTPEEIEAIIASYKNVV